MKSSPMATLVIAAIAASVTCRAWADDGHQHASGHQHGTEKKTHYGPRNGELSHSANTWHEVIFKTDGVRVYLYDSKGQPIDASRITGQVTMKVDGNPRSYRYDLYADATRGAAKNALHLSVNLSKVPENAMQVSFVIGIPGQAEPARFTQAYRITRSKEELAIAAQKICPVSGKPLGSMGAPPKIRLNGQDVYVCCAGCSNALKSNPVKYLARLQPKRAEPVKATKADATLVAHQKVCPVMDEPLNAMGGPWKIDVDGRPVFVCCKGCIKFIQKDSAKYLKKIPEPLPAKATKADAAAVAKQKLCPVMDEPLNAMGGPWKVYAKGKPLYVCCKGCIKKIQQHPDFYLAKATRTGQRNSR